MKCNDTDRHVTLLLHVILHDLDGDEKRPVLCEKEKEALRNEFLQNMQIRFLNGEDAGFNYR